MANPSYTIDMAARPHGAMTPAGIQPISVLRRRRLIYAILVIATCAALGWSIASAIGLARADFPILETPIFILSLLSLPWFATGLWNGLIGLWLLHGRKDGLHEAAPFLRAADGWRPLSVKTAILMTVRNEDPARAFARLSAIRTSLEATGEIAGFDFFLLSDTSNATIAAQEEAICRAWPEDSKSKLTYRRRVTNSGFKAGNIWDFIERWGSQYDLMLPLDADSVMSGDTILRLARIMQTYPKLGILQSLTVGTPARSAFARVFQFGMRHSMRSYTVGSAWWTGDCGPFWGHNALVRIKPFRDHCALPVLPGKPPFGGPILSHDQLEAALMRAAGYEVRVAPVEYGSYEDNPPSLGEFVKRDIRWCQGNMQYWRFLGWPGLKLVSRIQIALAIVMYLGAVATTLAVGLSLLSLTGGGLSHTSAAEAKIVLPLIFLIGLGPKLAGLVDVALTPESRARYGGLVQLGKGALAEMAFSTFLSVIVNLRSTVFMASLCLGRAVIWGGQDRDVHRVSWRDAWRAFTLETSVGAALAILIGVTVPSLLPWTLPIWLPLLFAVPFAVVTASPAVGQALAARKLCGIPEEFAPDEILSLIARQADDPAKANGTGSDPIESGVAGSQPIPEAAAS